MSLACYLENLPRLIRIAMGVETRKVLNAHGVLVEVQPTFKESIEAMKELGNPGIGSRFEVNAEPASPFVVQVMVGPELAAQQPELLANPFPST